MGMYDLELKLGSDALMGMRNDADITLQRLIRDMIEKNSSEANVSIGLKITLEKEWIQDIAAGKDENGYYPKRPIIKPVIDHRISSVMKIENKCNGENLFESYELVLDEEKGEFVLRPIANTEQQTIFDDQYQESVQEVHAIEANDTPLLGHDPDFDEEEDEFGEEEDEFAENMNPPQEDAPAESTVEADDDEFEDFSDEFD